MNSVVLVFFSLISLSLSAALKPEKGIVLIQNSDTAKCGQFILPAMFLQRQALEICKIQEESTKCQPNKCSPPTVSNRLTYYKGNLFPNEKTPLIVKKLKSDVYLKGQKLSSSYIVVKWYPKGRICSRVGVIHQLLNEAPFGICQSVDLQKTASRVDHSERGKTINRFNSLRDRPNYEPANAAAVIMSLNSS
ncbi:hypothetical protein HI914_04467 [Erysiphe necator]|nr:hypothetical protein HI914_04467 [Erysiphe necator]